MSQIPKTGTRTTLAQSTKSFLEDNPDLHLGGDVDFHQERAHHLKIFGFHNLLEDERASIGKVEHVIVEGPHGTIPIRLFHPESHKGDSKEYAALVYMHGGGYTVGSVDEFENGLRVVAQEAGVITIGVEYRLAPEHKFPVQLDEYAAVVAWAQSEKGSKYSIKSNLVFGGGDSAGGNMSAALALRLRDEGKKNIKGQILLYPKARLPFDTPAAVENNSGFYLECNGIFSFADHYLPRAPEKAHPPSHRHVSPGMQGVADLKDLPPAAVFTCGFDPLRDVGVEYASKLQEAGNEVVWHHYPELTHGFLQMAPWSAEAMKATKDVAMELKRLAYGSKSVQQTMSNNKLSISGTCKINLSHAKCILIFGD